MLRDGPLTSLAPDADKFRDGPPDRPWRPQRHIITMEWYLLAHFASTTQARFSGELAAASKTRSGTQRARTNSGSLRDLGDTTAFHVRCGLSP